MLPDGECYWQTIIVKIFPNIYPLYLSFFLSGHDHVNDYCLDVDGIALCYGGGMGVNGYGAGHLGWPRRARVWHIEDEGYTIRTWKRLDDDKLTMLHYQTLF